MEINKPNFDIVLSTQRKELSGLNSNDTEFMLHKAFNQIDKIDPNNLDEKHCKIFLVLHASMVNSLKAIEMLLK